MKRVRIQSQPEAVFTSITELMQNCRYVGYIPTHASEGYNTTRYFVSYIKGDLLAVCPNAIWSVRDNWWLEGELYGFDTSKELLEWVAAQYE